MTVRFSSLPLRTIVTSTSLPTGVSATTRGRSRISWMSLPSNLMIDIAGLDAGGLGRALFVDAGDQRAVRRLDIQAFGDVVGHLLDAHAEPAAPRFAELAKLVDDRDRGLRGHREADADRAAGGRDDRRIDADHLAVEIEQRAAGIAAIDGGVGLDVVVIGTGIDVAVARRHDAGRDGAAEAERIADRHHPFAEPQLVRSRRTSPTVSGLSGFTRSNARSTLVSRPMISALRRVPSLRMTVTSSASAMTWLLVTTMPGRIDDEAGAERVHPARRVLPVLIVALLTAAPVLEELVEELLERRAGRQRRHRVVAVVDTLRGRHVDHRIDDLFGNIGDVVRARAPAPASR